MRPAGSLLAGCQPRQCLSNTGGQLLIKDCGDVVLQERGGRALNKKHQQFGKKVKIITSLIALFEMLPNPRGGSGQESAAKMRMGTWCGDNGLYTALDFWLIGNLFIVSFSRTFSSALHRTVSHIGNSLDISGFAFHSIRFISRWLIKSFQFRLS